MGLHGSTNVTWRSAVTADRPSWAALVCIVLGLGVLAGCGTDTGGGGTATDGSALDATAADATVASDTQVDDGTTAADTAGDAATAADTTGAADVATGPTFHAVWADVLVAHGCTGTYCHGGVWPNEDTAYAELMKAKTGVAKCSSKTLVVPGKPEQSLLWLKSDASAAHGCGVKMPIGSPTGLPADLSKLLKDWITAGAKR